MIVAVEDFCVFALEDLRLDDARQRFLNLLLRRPEVAQVDGLPVTIEAQRLGGQVNVHLAGERVGDDQRRRGQVRRAHLRVDAPLEVAVAAQHRHDHQVLVAHDLGHRLRQRPRIADAVVNRDCPRDEGVQIVYREVVDGRTPAGRRSMTWSAKVGSVSASFSTQ